VIVLVHGYVSTSDRLNETWGYLVAYMPWKRKFSVIISIL